MYGEWNLKEDKDRITNYLQSIADDLVVTSRMNNNLESIAKSINTLVKILEEKK